MSRAFEQSVSALWRSLDLPAPDLGRGPRVVLSIDGVEVSLEETPDGAGIWVSARIGRLSEDTGLRARQVSRLLRLGLGLVVGNRGCVVLDPQTRSTVTVEAAVPYGAATPPRLQETVQDVVYQAEILGAELRPGAAAPARPAPVSSERIGEDLIFRP
ncbi:type III secretion system chaperone [Prosthecomicrobium sp. N25]|uniref:type III secretion system chaperone n=1 Tax=Prosthecomicrobium sp. N25 TaxID=3129254 RepID=UPI00307887DA